MPDRSLTLAVFIDALGWELLEERAFLDDVLTCKAPLRTIFGYSSSCDPTILTGTRPRDHGHFSFFSYAPERSPFRGFNLLGLLPPSIANRGRVRHLISRVTRPLLGFTGYFQLYAVPFRLLPLMDYSERRDIYRPGGIAGGQSTVFSALDGAGVPYHCSDWRASEADNLAAAHAAIDEGTVEFAYLFLGHLDAILHEHGARSPQGAAKVAWYDAEIRGLLQRARTRYSRIQLMVFSDHGMTDVNDHCDLMARIDALGLEFGRDYAAVYDSTMARFWFLRPEARVRILEALAAEPRGRVLTQAELAAWGCDFPGATYGELFFLLNPGVLLHPSFMGREAPRGMHGFDPAHAGSTAMFAANFSPNPMPTGLEHLRAVMLDAATRRAPETTAGRHAA